MKMVYLGVHISSLNEFIKSKTTHKPSVTKMPNQKHLCTCFEISVCHTECEREKQKGLDLAAIQCSNSTRLNKKVYIIA